MGHAHYTTKFSGAKRRKVLTQDKFYYIPLLSTLNQLLQIKCVREETLQRSQHSNGQLCDISDGEIYKNHSLFMNNPHGLQIIAYYDEVEVCNPLGSYSGKQKLGCFFFTLGNIRPAFRSSLNSIFLVAVAKSTTIKENGLDSILKPFINDLDTLSKDGIKITFDGKEEVWKGALMVFLADNLAAHELGGFKESFSFARRICRSCLADKDSLKHFFRECEFEVRTPETHAEHCKLLEGPNGAANSTEYGINRVPLLESVSNFSVVEGMPHDIMHDLYEGVVPHEFKMLLQHCLAQSYFDLDYLNHRLQSFDFGYSENGDKPALLSDATKIRQTASQMKLFSKIFPFLVGDRIPDTDENWICYILLLKICDICVSGVLKVDSASYLEILIEEHHTKFKTLYPATPIIPKMHFMIHYPKQIINYGPLVHTWTMRHEAKLRILKRAARVSNFKNVCQTVAKRHQHLLCIHMHNMLSNGLARPPETGPLKLLNLTETTASALKQSNAISENSICYSTTFVNYNGITYKPNAFILQSSDPLHPVFLKIITIIKCDSEVYLELTVFNTEDYDSHYHAYCLSPQEENVLVYNVRFLPFNLIFHSRRIFGDCFTGKKFISHRYMT